jgi:hypothetical protein
MKEEISQAQPLEKREMVMPVGYSGQILFQEGAVWHVDPLLSNNHETSNYTAAIAK